MTTPLWIHDGDPIDATASTDPELVGDTELLSEQDLHIVEEAELDALARSVAPVGYTIRRGSYSTTSDDRLDRWYVEREDATSIDRRGSGYASIAEAVEAALYEAVADLPVDLRAARDRLGYSQTAMADALGVPMRTYQSWEGGQEPQHPSLIRLALAEVERRA